MCDWEEIAESINENRVTVIWPEYRNNLEIIDRDQYKDQWSLLHGNTYEKTGKKFNYLHAPADNMKRKRDELDLFIVENPDEWKEFNDILLFFFQLNKKLSEYVSEITKINNNEPIFILTLCFFAKIFVSLIIGQLF